MSDDFHFAGFSSPNTTSIPDEFFDVLAPRLTEPELRVCLYIMRRTFGFKKDADTISLKQMVEGITTRDGRVLDAGTGMAKSSVALGIKGLVAKGVVEAVRNSSPERGDLPTTYTLRFRGEAPVSTTRTPRVHHTDTPLSSSRTPRVQRADTQDPVEQQTDLQGFDHSNDTSPVDKSLETTRGAFLAGEITLGTAIDAARDRRALREARSQQSPAAPAPAPRRRREPAPHLERLIGDFSREFHDAAHTASNLSQARRIMADAGVDEQAMVDAAYEARAVARERGNIKKTATDGSPAGTRNRMPYFFVVLRDVLGLEVEG